MDASELVVGERTAADAPGSEVSAADRVLQVLAVLACAGRPLSASELMQGKHKIENPSDVLAHTLLHHEEAQGAWSQWAAVHGITHQLLITGPRFAQYSALIQAARCGLGIAFVPLILVEDELAEGVLVTPFDGSTAVEHGHYLCYRPDRMQFPAFAQLRQWLLAEGGGQEAVSNLPGHP